MTPAPETTGVTKRLTHVTRAPLLLLTLTSACQCFVPPEELSPDAGALDAGLVDAGLDAGDGRVECRQASECQPPPFMLDFCTAPGAHCLDGRCVWDCNGGLTCNRPTTDLGCAECQGARSCLQCGLPQCLSPGEVVIGVQRPQGTCPAPFTEGAAFVLSPQRAPKACAVLIDRDGGQVVGEWYGELDGGRRLLSIPALGGTCVASNLFTGAPRMRVSCPSCTFLSMGCE